MSTWELPCEERDFSFFSVLIHPSAWNTNSANFALTEF
jgi:hypothetical protein